MTVNNSITPLSADDAFCAGSDLWIVRNQQSQWWQAIDFKSGFLLSSSLLFKKNNNTPEVQEIVAKTESPVFDFKNNDTDLLLGTANHFFNKWVLVLDGDLESKLPEIENISRKLQAKSIRLFGFERNEILDTTTRLSTSLPQITFVE